MFRAKKRFLQMSLLTWFLIFSILCVLAFAYARFIRPSQVEANAIRGLENLGIKVTVYYEHDFEDQPSCSVPVPPGPTWVKAIFGEMVLARISSVGLEGEFKTLDGCRDLLNQLNHLKSIDVESSTLEDVTALKQMDGLECVTFRGLNRLKNIDALSSTNISVIVIRDCKGLTSLDSLGQLQSLDRLLIDNCSGLREINLNSWETPQLTYLNIASCDQLVTVDGFPRTSETCCLELFDCQALEKITLQQKSNLDELFVDFCGKLDSINVLPESLTGLRIHYCNSLRKIEGQRIPMLKHVDVSGLPESISFDLRLESAEIITLSECDGIRDLDFSQTFSQLKELHITCCKGLLSLHSLPMSVEKVFLYDCKSLERIKPENSLPNLIELSWSDCPNLSDVPEELVPRTAAKKF